MAKFETVPIGDLKHRLPAKLLPLVEEYKDKLEKLSADKAAAGSLNRRIRFPFRGEDGALSFYLEARRGRRGRRAASAEAGAESPKRRRGRPRKTGA